VNIIAIISGLQIAEYSVQNGENATERYISYSNDPFFNRLEVMKVIQSFMYFVNFLSLTGFMTSLLPSLFTM